MAGEGVGCWLLQPEPMIEAVTLPDTPVGTMIPVTRPLIVQLEQDRPEYGMENAPLLATAVVPVTSGGTQNRDADGSGTRELST